MNRTALVEMLAADYVAHEVLGHSLRTAGEIRHVKDTGPVKRKYVDQHDYNPKNLKALTKVLWQVSIALGHLSSASSDFAKMKSVNISPDGRLGGNGYDKSIRDIRKDMYTAVEALSGMVDTLHDEVTAPHWHPESLPPKDAEEVKGMVDEIEDIQDDADAFGEKEYDKAHEDDEEEEKDDTTDETSPPLNESEPSSDEEGEEE